MVRKCIVLLLTPAIIVTVILTGCSAGEKSTPTTTTTASPTATTSPFTAPGATTVAFPGQAGAISAYQVRPAGDGPFPALIVIHENRGLTDHIKDVARRFAGQGYLTLAVDLLSRVGGKEKYPVEADAIEAVTELPAEGVVQDLQSAFEYLKTLSYVKPQNIGVIGYCWGGGNSLLMATRVNGLRTAVVYYGPNPSNIDSIANIAGPVLGIYGELDTRITVNVPQLAEAMKKHGKTFEYKIYPDAAHAFFNDTGTRYSAVAATDAWKVTLEFLERNLK